MKFSLIVVTTDRLHLVERLFASLAAQTHKNFEILFVHGKECTAEAQALADTHAASLDIRAFASTDHCLSRSRNAALPLVNGDVVAFPDDDCVCEPDTLAQCAAVFEENPRIHALAARVFDLHERVVPPARSAVQKLNSFSVFRHSVSFAQFHRRECIHAVGGFDENLGVGCATPYQSGEDTDYMLRAFKCGFFLAYAPSIAVRHPAVDPRDAGMSSKTHAYAMGRMRLLRKYDMPAWFVLMNIAYPLACMPVDCIKASLPSIRYRWSMFTARLGGLLSLRKNKDWRCRQGGEKTVST